MHLKSLTLKGFKSFPDRTRLDFGPGVSVVVGPNGSGKSNVTDALLWAMGEQSPLAVRGSSMQDVIFGGGRGVQPRSSAEVEIVLDNSDGTVGDLPVAEISIVRRLDRSGEGEYRLNGARCRLVDVIEVLSDTGLGKETHSVVSQGRVEAIVTSKPRDRRLLIEEAAGLGKHRKRRRRAQLKLQRTQENLDRALDVEREARTRLRPLKRQAEAAQLHERLERQMLQARLVLAREAVRATREQLAHAEEAVAAARARRGEIESRLEAVAGRRAAAESALEQRTERHDALSRRAYEARSARERLQLRAEQAAATAQTLHARAERIEAELAVLERLTASSLAADASERAAGEDRIAALEGELARLDADHELQVERELEGLRGEQQAAEAAQAQAQEHVAQARARREQADAVLEHARAALRSAEGEAEAARREAARVGAELAAANQFLRSHARSLGADEAHEGPARALSGALQVKKGYELALAAALGGRLDAALVSDMQSANDLLDKSGPDGGAALLTQAGLGTVSGHSSESAGGAAGQSGGAPGVEEPGSGKAAVTDVHLGEPAATPPCEGAVALAELLSGEDLPLALARRLLADAWVVQRLEDLPGHFKGIATTRSGRALFAAWGEVRQLTEGGAERVLARRNERDQLIAASEACAAAEHAAKAAVEQAQQQLREADSERERAAVQLRESERSLAEAAEAQRKTAWLIEQRRAAPEQGAAAVRRAELQGELAAERRQAERVAVERAERARRMQRLRAQHASDQQLAPRAERLAAALAQAGEAAEMLLAHVQELLKADRAEGEQVALQLRACAQEEAQIQSELRTQGEAVTGAEVAAQRLRDQAAEAEQELREVSERLELPTAEEEHVEPHATEEGVGPRAAGDVAGPLAEAEHTGAPSAGVDAGPLAEGEHAALPSAGADAGLLAEAEHTGAPSAGPDAEPLAEEERQALEARLERLARRREQLGPVNPLAQEEYAEALAHVEELEGRRSDLETALRELNEVIRETDRQIHDTFHATFSAAARNFEELVGDVFPGGSGRLKLVKDEPAAPRVLGGLAPAPGGDREGAALQAESAEEAADQEAERDPEEELLGVEIEITPAGKSAKRLSLLSGGEKSMTALAFLFAVFLARPCPFYVLDEVEAALDDLNLDRFLELLRRYAGRAQFIVITHQKRTMEAADWLYGVSMADNGVSKVLSRRLPKEQAAQHVVPVA